MTTSRTAVLLGTVLVLLSYAARSDEPARHGYRNTVNRLTEGPLEIRDDRGRPAVIEPAGPALGTADLRIVWTLPVQFDWNYSVPELHSGKGLYKSDHPSPAVFLERKLRARTALEVSVPDTPYSFYILDGQFSPFFRDGEKQVIWHLDSPEVEKLFRRMRTVSGTSKRLVLSAPGGDMAEFLVVDFSHRDNAPAVTYRVRYDGP